MSRITVWLHPDQADPLGNGLQALHGKFALGVRRLVGRRASAAPRRSGARCPRRTPTSSSRSSARSSGWSAPSPCSRLFGVIGYAGLRVALEATEPFVRYAAAGVTAWVLVQALVNIGAVLGLLPITGVPLPLVSYGGSALVPTMLGLGMLLSFARPRGVRRRRRLLRRLARRAGEVAVHVVVAGGGSAGHIEPALAFADALRRRDPSAEVTALGTERGLDTRIIPARGYELALIPPVPIPRRPGRDLFARARPAAGGRARRRPTCCASQRADVLVGFGGFVSGPAYLAARRLGVPIVVHEANPRPGWANRLGARLTPYVATTFPGTPIAHGRQLGLPIRRSIATLDRAARPRRGARDLRPGRRPADAAGDRRLAGRASGSTTRPPVRPPALRAAGVQVLHATGTGAHRRRSDRRAGAPPYVVVPYLDRMDLALRRRRPGAVPGRGQHGGRADRGRAAGGVRAAADRQRRAGADRPAGGRGRRRAAGRRRRTAPPPGCAATLTPLLTDPERLADDGRGGREQRSAGRATSGSSTWRSRRPRPDARGEEGDDGERASTVAPTDLPVPAEQLGRVHFIGIGGAGMSGIARIMLARGLPVSAAATPRTRSTLAALRALGADGAPRARGRERRRASTPWWSPPRSGSATPSWSRPAGAGCASCTGPARWPR